MKKLLRISNVLQMLGGISKPTLWRLRCTDPSFPKPIRITGSTLGFYEDELVEWLESRRASTVRIRF